MGLNAGQLNRRIQVRRATMTLDDLGRPQYEWADHGSPIFARRRDVSDAERISAGAWENKLVTRFVIRATSFGQGITRSDQLVHEGVTYAISGIKEVPPGKAFIEITAVTEETE